MLREGHQKVVSAMASQFEEQGYHIEYVMVFDCYLFASSWLRFTPTGRGRVVNDYLGVFNLEDWKPLEGNWKQMDQSKHYKGWWGWSRRSYEFQTAESCAIGSIQDKQSPEEALPREEVEAAAKGNSMMALDDEVVTSTFVSNCEESGKMLWIRVRSSQTGWTEGNTHVMKDESGNATCKITPIQTGNVSCYRWGGIMNTVSIVRGSNTLIDFNLEEIPLIVSDGSLLKEGRRWIEFQKTGLVHSGTFSETV
jgi:hypothetical protein